MHCSREGHDWVEMRLLDENHEDGTLTYRCPECGREEKQYVRTAGSPPPEGNLLTSIIANWRNGRAAITRLSDSICDALTREKPRSKVRHDVRIDRDRRELHVARGPSIPFDHAEVRVYRSRSEENYFRWGDGADSLYSEKTTVLTYEVYVKYGNVRITLAEFDSRSGAEKYASELRDAIGSG